MPRTCNSTAIKESRQQLLEIITQRRTKTKKTSTTKNNETTSPAESIECNWTTMRLKQSNGGHQNIRKRSTINNTNCFLFLPSCLTDSCLIRLPATNVLHYFTLLSPLAKLFLYVFSIRRSSFSSSSRQDNSLWVCFCSIFFHVIV